MRAAASECAEPPPVASSSSPHQPQPVLRAPTWRWASIFLVSFGLLALSSLAVFTLLHDGGGGDRPGGGALRDAHLASRRMVRLLAGRRWGSRSKGDRPHGNGTSVASMGKAEAPFEFPARALPASSAVQAADDVKAAIARLRSWGVVRAEAHANALLGGRNRSEYYSLGRVKGWFGDVEGRYDELALNISYNKARTSSAGESNSA